MITLRNNHWGRCFLQGDEFQIHKQDISVDKPQALQQRHKTQRINSRHAIEIHSTVDFGD
jgi:hypothetical protein